MPLVRGEQAPGGEGDQKQRGAAKECRLDPLELPEAARRLVDGMREVGSVTGQAALADPLEAVHAGPRALLENACTVRQRTAGPVARRLADNPSLAEVRTGRVRAPGRRERSDEALPEPGFDEEAAGHIDRKRNHQSQCATAQENSDRECQPEREKRVAERDNPVEVELVPPTVDLVERPLVPGEEEAEPGSSQQDRAHGQAELRSDP